MLKITYSLYNNWSRILIGDSVGKKFTSIMRKLGDDLTVSGISKRCDFMHALRFINFLTYGDKAMYMISIVSVDKNKDGYKPTKIGKDTLHIRLGKSHDLVKNIPSDFYVRIGRKNKSCIMKSMDIEGLYNYLFSIRQHRLPEPYKGKGVVIGFEKIYRKKIRKLRNTKNYKRRRKS